MPIYVYRCAVCDHQQDVLQKISDAPLVECPQCHSMELQKQVTAAGFQLKGSGWYVTDFRNSGNNAKNTAKETNEADKSKNAEKDAGGSSDNSNNDKGNSKDASNSDTGTGERGSASKETAPASEKAAAPKAAPSTTTPTSS